MHYIPPETERKLAVSPTKGYRHNWCKDICITLAANGWGDDDIVKLLVPKLDQERDWPTEIRILLEWVRTQDFTPTPQAHLATEEEQKEEDEKPEPVPVYIPPPARRTQPMTPEFAVQNAQQFLRDKPTITVAELGGRSPVPLPANTLDGAHLLFQTLYEQGDLINIVTEFHSDKEGNLKPHGAGQTMTATEWLSFQSAPYSEAGSWFRFNPVTRRCGSGKGGAFTDADIAKYRFLLLESDILPPDYQASLYLALSLPIAALIDSGGRSIHAYVAINAESLEFYRQHARRIMDLLLPFGFDPANKNASRLSRLPGVPRKMTNRWQELLYLDPDPLKSGKVSLALFSSAPASSPTAAQAAQVPPSPIPPLAQIQAGNPAIRLPSKGRTHSIFARELGGILRPQNFYGFNNVCCSVEFNDKIKGYEPVRVQPQAFRTAIEAYCVPYMVAKENGKRVRFDKTLSADDAVAVLASQHFLSELRPLCALNFIQLPFCAEGKVELLPIGYHQASQILTLEQVFTYQQDLPFKDAVASLDSLLNEVCFQPDDKVRGKSVVLAEMLTLYCTHLLPDGALRPGFLFSSNAEGAGKTTLAFLAIIPRLGFAASACAAGKEDEMRKEVLAVALAAKPVFFIDNLKQHLSSSALERLITTPVIEGRILGESRQVSVPHNLTVILTGNGATISPDLRRRLLIVELFLPEARAEDHDFKQPLSYERIVELSPKILSALWSLVRNWAEKGSPLSKVVLNGFKAWSQIIGGILQAAGFDSPIGQAEHLKHSGDRESVDMETLADQMNPGHQYTFAELVTLAQDNELFEWLLGDGQSPLDAQARARFGRLLKRKENRIFQVTGANKNPFRGKFLIEGETRKTRRFTLVML